MTRSSTLSDVFPSQDEIDALAWLIVNCGEIPDHSQATTAGRRAVEMCFENTRKCKNPGDAFKTFFLWLSLTEPEVRWAIVLNSRLNETLTPLGRVVFLRRTNVRGIEKEDPLLYVRIPEKLTKSDVIVEDVPVTQIVRKKKTRDTLTKDQSCAKLAADKKEAIDFFEHFIHNTYMLLFKWSPYTGKFGEH